MAQEFEGGFEVVVVVDGSKDGSAEALRALQAPFPLTVLEQDNQGSATARNRGSSVARGEILLFLDDDMEAHPRLLAEHERSHSEGANAVLGHIPLHPGAPVNFLTAEFKLWAEQRASRLSQPGASLTLQDLLTGQISVRREVFEKAGRFDVNFTLGGAYGNSDVDFGYRLLNGGSKIVFNLYALSYHNYVIQPRNYLRQARKTGRADVAFARKHPAQARAIFEPYTTGRGLRPQFWRATALLRPLSIPLMAALRSFALSLVEHGIEGPRTVRFFNEIFEMEYWRGVHEAGGMP
jgi:glycosyltransferase involved in cell wall biosynthesis